MTKKKEPLPGGFPAGLSAPAQRALAGAGYTQIEQLAAVTEADILKLHGMGPKSMPLLREALAAKGLRFADKVK
ncbi:MAG TPA: DNA-directed RNA polymerase subunit alpha C-terminal domain-containing protein [Roseiflexaceae bacterium]|nr:DNA-directed RNA polymerase subunit alpha C-terminal domain-containing protein [Roseiflexaceae bacterium]